MSTRDESRPVREEDAFDVGAVAAWLREHAHDDGRAYDLPGTPEVRQFPGGASNLTYLLSYPGRDLVLRRPPVGAKAKSAHDMGREHDIQLALAPVFPYVATMVGLCRDESVIGSPFYVMERLEGTIPRRSLGFDATPEQVSTLCGRAWDVLVDLHAVDVDAIPALAALNRGSGYVGRQVGGWTDRLERAATDDLGDWSPVTTWLDAEQPPDAAHCLIHNDFRFDNLVLDAASLRVTGVLDWEMATVGDPLMELGGALAYWVEAGDDEFFQQFRRQPSSVPGMWTRAEIVEHYTARAGLVVTPEQWRFYEVFGLFRLAVIAQQIWYRYVQGQTHNEAYAVFGPAVGYLEQRCRRVLGGLMGQVLLVRHGQASFGAADYDVLSELGWTQGRVLGARLAAEGLVPTTLVTGGMRRHAETATAMTDGAGWVDVPVEVDPGWAEFDHLGVVAALPDAGAIEPGDRRGFQRVFERATARWASGEHDGDYGEPYGGFVARASEALARACEREGPVVVVSSGGPVAAACAALVAQGAPAGTGAVLPTLWRHFNTVQVNAAVTRVLVGPSGRRLLTFNEHAHLGPESISYR